MTPLAVGAGVAFLLLGGGAERLAAVWPAEEASARRPGARTVALAIGSGVAGWAVAARSTLPAWATLVELLLVALLVLLAATDLEQRRLPHLLLDPLIVIAAAFALVNPGLELLSAVIGAGVAVAFLGLLGLLVRAGVALGDLYLVAPIGLMLGWPAIFVAIFAAALLSSLTSLVLLATRRVGLRSYIPFGPFLVIGTVLTLVRDEQLLGSAAALGALLPASW